jgi:thiol-disulfide isomerase/thioredoxin
MSRPFQIVLVVVLLTAAGVLGFGAYRLFAKLEPQPQQAAPVVIDAPVQQSDVRPTPPKGLPETRPVFALRDRDGRLRSIKEWDGKSLVINFWATWCPPCRREIPMLNALHAARAGDNVEVIGVAVDFREDVLAYAKNVGIDYPLLIGEQDGLDAVSEFGLGSIGFPFTVFTDNQGRIVTAHLGELHANEANLILDAVVDVNAGRLSLEQAKAAIAAGLEKLESAGKA